MFPVPGVANGGTTLTSPASLPGSTQMATIDASGNIATQAIPSAGISGSLGSTDNALLRADGVGGSAAQGSAAILADDGSLRALSFTANAADGASSLILDCQNGLNGARIVAPNGSALIQTPASLNLHINQLNFNPGGSGRSRLSHPEGWQLANSQQFCWSSGTAVGTPNVGLASGGAAIVKATNGSTGAGTFTGFLNPEPFSTTTLPSPSAYQGSTIRVIDRNQRRALSRYNGIAWEWAFEDSGLVVS